MAQLTSYTPTITVHAAGREWTLERAADLETLWNAMSEEGDAFDDERLPYWTELWPSSLVLADWLYSNKERIQGKHCLDIGCGLGLCSLVGTWLGAHVVAMDYEAEALYFARKNAFIKNVPMPLWTVMDWRYPAVVAQSIDHVWGDIMYEKRFVEPVLDFLDSAILLVAGWQSWTSVYDHFQSALKKRGRALRHHTAQQMHFTHSLCLLRCTCGNFAAR